MILLLPAFVIFIITCYEIKGVSLIPGGKFETSHRHQQILSFIPKA